MAGGAPDAPQHCVGLHPDAAGVLAVPADEARGDVFRVDLAPCDDALREEERLRGIVVVRSVLLFDPLRDPRRIQIASPRLLCGPGEELEREPGDVPDHHARERPPEAREEVG